MRKKEMVALGIVFCLFLLGCSGCQQDTTRQDEWNELNSRFDMLYEQGRYSEAATVAEEALKVAEKTFGPDHPNVATSLNNLALLYNDQGKYAEAELLFKRALAIDEGALGPDHPEVATVLENMAGFYEEIGKKDEAKRLEERAKEIRFKNQ